MRSAKMELITDDTLSNYAGMILDVERSESVEIERLVRLA